MSTGRRTFRSKHEAQNMRKHSWGCLRCDAVYDSKRKVCDLCQNPVQYFPSKKELIRFQALRFQQRIGALSGLEVQPSFKVVLNGQHVFTYRADFRYREGEREVIEDVKGTTDERHLDPVFKLKRKIVEAVFGIRIEIVKA